MVNLTFTGVVRQDLDVHTMENRNTIAMFPVDVREEPHLPPTRILVVAAGKQAVYAQEAIKQGSLVMVGGWSYTQKNAKGIEPDLCTDLGARLKV